MRLLFILVFLFAAWTIFFPITTLPFKITPDLTLNSGYEKKGIVPDTDVVYGFTFFTDRTRNILSNSNEQLVGFHCSDAFFRNSQGVYLLENIQTKKRYVKRVKNKVFIEYLRNKEPLLEKGMKILTGKVCENDNAIFLFYTIGKYKIPLDNSLSSRSIITYSTGNKAYVEVFSRSHFFNNRLIEIANSKTHLRCDHIFQMSNSKVWVLCHVEGDWISNYMVYEVDIKKSKIKLVERCDNRFEKKLATVCN